ncbi:MAG: GntR family transcriptional regulator [Pseudorhodobacter sp.]
MGQTPLTRPTLNFRIEPDRMAQSQAISLLRDSILTGELKPGMRLSEQEIANAMGISRQPVREAFIRLAGEGLLEVWPQRGTFVSKISAEEVLDARFVREAVEADLVRLATERKDDALLAALNDNLEQQNSALTDAARFMRLDEIFHRTIAEAAGKGRAWDHLQKLKSQLDRVRFLATQDFPVQILITQHTRIVEAIATGNPDLAEAALRAHLCQMLEDLPRINVAYPDYFAPRRDA